MEYAEYLATGEMSEGFLREDQHVMQIEEQDTPITVPASEELDKLARRKKNFSDKEDEMLVSAWLNIGLDPVVGTQQKAGSFWTRIYELYLETAPADEVHHRTKKALEHRWGHIQENVNKFCGCLDQIHCLRASGTTEPEKLSDACTMFKEVHNRSFNLLYCWTLLRNHPKWNSFLSLSKNKTARTSNPSSSVPATDTLNTNSSINLDDNTPSNSSDYMRRPPGKKAVKKRARDGTGSSYDAFMDDIRNGRRERDEKLSQMQEQTLTVEMEMVAIKKEKVRVQENELQLKREQLQFEQQLKREQLELDQQMRREKLEIEKQKGFGRTREKKSES